MTISRTISVIAAAAALAACFALPANAAKARTADPQVPNLDVTPTCRALDHNDMQIDEKRCRQSEADARDQLKRDWASFPAANRSQCITTATMGGTASYVELITCLEMLNDVAGLPASKDSKETLRTKPTGLGPQR
jgi:ABC-type glycerol-3-phosphate transport system substrate-binding protein